MTPRQLAAHWQASRFGRFRLTDAIRPAPDDGIVPQAGYRLDTYFNARTGLSIPLVAAAVSRETLFEAFLALLPPLGAVVDVVLETSHESRRDGHRDLRREGIDRPVLESILYDFEELLLHDGCTGIAVVSSRRPMEVQLDEHKLIFAYARNRAPFRRTLREHGVKRRDGLQLISEGPHLHGSDPKYARLFQQLAMRLGVGTGRRRYHL